MNTHDKEDFSRLNELSRECRNADVGWTLQFEQCEGRWYLEIMSSSPVEERYFRKYEFASDAIADAIAWIKNGFKDEACS